MNLDCFQFGREVLAHKDLLNAEDRVDWKECKVRSARHITSKSVMIAKLQWFLPCHENWLIITIPTTLHNINGSVKSDTVVVD